MKKEEEPQPLSGYRRLLIAAYYILNYLCLRWLVDKIPETLVWKTETLQQTFWDALLDGKKGKNDCDLLIIK